MNIYKFFRKHCEIFVASSEKFKLRRVIRVEKGSLDVVLYFLVNGMLEIFDHSYVLEPSPMQPF